MKWIDVLIIFLYFAVMIVVGFIGSLRARTSEDYAVAGRNLGFFLFFGCMSAVVLGGAATIGTAKLGYQYGISGMWFVAMIGFGMIVLGSLFIKYLKKAGVTTISELLGNRYRQQTRYLSAVVSAIYTLMISVTQVIGMGKILQAIMGWDSTISMIAGGGIVLFYTLLGGMWSVTLTDFVQFVIMTVGIFFILLPMSLLEVGGWSTLVAKLPASYFDLANMGWKQIFQYFLLYCLGLVVSQDIWQRVFTGKNESVSKQGAIAAGLYSIAYAIAMSIVGMCGVLLFPNAEDSQNIFAMISLKILPQGALGLVLAAVCAALMSTASGAMLASATLITNDLLKPFLRETTEKKIMLLSRLTTFAVGVLAILFAGWIQDILVALDVAYAILSGAIFVPVVLGFFWKKASAQAGFYAILLATVVVIGGLMVEGISSTNPILYGIVASLLSMIFFSYLFPSQKAKVGLDQ